MRKIINCTQSAHLDLFWMGSMKDCMKRGAEIIDAAVQDLAKNPEKYFVVETVRFLEYYLDQYPQNKQLVISLLQSGQLEVGACYTDRLENHHDGESLVRNVVYGKRLLNKMTGCDTHIAAHPDLPGLTEQTPQIYNLAGIRYYCFARGFEFGTRFKWKALNGKSIIAYNFPVHYAYYDHHRVLNNLGKIRKALQSDNVLLSFSAGDLGDYGSFKNKKHQNFEVSNIMDEYNRSQDENCLALSNVYDSLSAMDEDCLRENSGESPCRWGTYGSATNVVSFKQDKRLSAALADAEKLAALCELNQINLCGFHREHPFCREVSSHLMRVYYDAKETPETINEWIDFAWRLQLVTQDHNYGGVDGTTSAFDRFVYKKCAIEIAESIITYCMQVLAGRIDSGDGLVVVNPLNWKRSGKVRLNQRADMDNNYAARNAAGIEYPVVKDVDGWYFEPELEALGYDSFSLVKQAGDRQQVGVTENSERVILESPYYTATVDKQVGGLVSLVDKQSKKELAGSVPIGVFSLYEDYSVDVHEEIYDKKLLASTAGRIEACHYGEDVLYTWVEWSNEIGDSKVSVTLKLSRTRKEFQILPKVCWIGHDNSQLRMSIGWAADYQNLYYGVPYGIQKMGKYMQGAEPANPTDEISMELFREYREVQGWFALENERFGLSIGTDQSSFAFRAEHAFEAVLIRDVRSCGDHDVMMDNHGVHHFKFYGTSFENDSILTNDTYYKKAWEMFHPLLRANKEGSGKGCLPETGVLLQVDGGILSVLQKDKTTYKARIFSVWKGTRIMRICQNNKEQQMEVCDLMGNQLEEDKQLQFGDIKTVRMSF